jgi:hypothetical protein
MAKGGMDPDFAMDLMKIEATQMGFVIRLKGDGFSSHLIQRFKDSARAAVPNEPVNAKAFERPAAALNGMQSGPSLSCG